MVAVHASSTPVGALRAQCSQLECGEGCVPLQDVQGCWEAPCLVWNGC